MRIAARRADKIGGNAFAVVQQRFQQMLDDQRLVALVKRNHLRRLDEAFGTFGELFEIGHMRSGRQQVSGVPTGSARLPYHVGKDGVNYKRRTSPYA